MKKVYFLFALIAISVTAFAQTTYTWDGSSVNSTTGTNANITSAQLGSTQGNNNGTTTLISTTSVSSGYTGATGTSNFGAACFTGALSTATSTYFSVTVTPASNYYLTLNSISLGSRGTGTGPLAITIYSSIDNYATAIGTATVSASSSWALSSITLSGANVGGTSSAVTLRIYGSNGTGSPSANTANWRIDDISLNVSASSTLAVSDIKVINSNFVKNTLVSNEINFGAKSSVKVYNMSGQVVKEASVSENKPMDVSFLSKGTYVVTGIINGKEVSEKIIKK